MKDDGSEYNWLPGYEPSQAVLRARNSLVIAAPLSVVWDQLIAATSWPKWFRLCQDVALPDGKVFLGAGMRFRWTMQGIRFDSAIYEFEPGRRLSWRSSNRLITTCHIWAFEQQNGGTNVVTVETQRGLLPTVLGFIVKPKLNNGQVVWLGSLAAQATSGV